MEEVEKFYPDQSKEAKAWFKRMLVHYNDVVLPKDDRGEDRNEALVLLQRMTGAFAAQV